MIWARMTLLAGLALLIGGWLLGELAERRAGTMTRDALATAIYAGGIATLALALLIAIALLPEGRGPRSRGRRWGLPTAAYLGWLLVPIAIWASSWNVGGGLLDPPCSGDWARQQIASPTSRCESEVEAWPPFAIRIVVYNPEGPRQATFPGRGTWTLVIVLALAPVALWPLARRVARAGRPS